MGKKKQSVEQNTVDDLGLGDIVDMPDILLPDTDEPVEIIEDTFNGAFKFAFIGAGQGGGNIASEFYSIGYRRVCAVNTAIQDLEPLQIPSENKLRIGQGGAGKDPAIGEQAVDEKREDIFDLMKTSFGSSVDKILITIGSGGGTGSGAVVPLIEIAHDYAKSIKATAKHPVGVICALPKNDEPGRVNSNAIQVLKTLIELKDQGVISPLIIIDNERVKSLYPKVSVHDLWKTINQSTCKLFHLFNILSAQSSTYTTFDKADLNNVLDSGLITFGITVVRDTAKDTAITQAIRSNLQNNILVTGLDLSKATSAGCIFVASHKLLSEIPQVNLDRGFEMLGRMLASGSTIHRGIYAGNKDNLVVYTVIGGLPAPSAKLAEMEKLSKG